MVAAFIIISIIIAFVAVGLGAAYTTGALDPVIQKVAMLFFKAKAEAEAKKLQAQGLKEGEDFMKGDLAGNQQANDVKEGLGGIGGGLDGLKKGF